VHRDRVFGLEAVTRVPGVAEKLLVPHRAWADEAAWEAAARKLAAKFKDNFATYAAEAGPDILAAGPA
jgi:phosphoenolpyruvate carboxykinase (ATP)